MQPVSSSRGRRASARGPTKPPHPPPQLEFVNRPPNLLEQPSQPPRRSLGLVGVGTRTVPSDTLKVERSMNVMRRGETDPEI